jgi:DNA-binding NtrC family response regulator
MVKRDKKGPPSGEHELPVLEDEFAGESEVDTEHFSTEEISLRKGEGSHRVSLLIYTADGVEVVPLLEGQSVVIGRTRPADVLLEDESLSRQHAQAWRDREGIWVKDLESTNGTFVNGEKVTIAQVHPGAQMAFGNVAAALHALEEMEASYSRPESHDAFQSRLEAEVERAHSHGRHLALMMVRAANREDKSIEKWAPTIQRRLKSYESMAFYSVDTIEILLPEADEKRPSELAGQLAKDGFRLACGFCLYPHDAASAGELVELTRKAMLRAKGKDLLQKAQPASDREGKRTASWDRGPVIESVAMRSVFRTVTRLASSNIPVLIQGETGTGKEIVARAIHQASKRKGNPLIFFNCGSIPPQLVQSTLFGHEKGAFTGAETKMEGLFEAADKGTILLDEVGELPQPAQTSLLRVLETKRFTRVGASKEIEVDVRILAATHRNLETMAEEGTFREDLLYRLNAMTLPVPPLREREADIEPLAQAFLEQANQQNETTRVKGIDDEALELMQTYSWPGNVRELRNAIERAVVVAQGDVITAADLPVRLTQGAPADPKALGETDLDLREQTRMLEQDLILQALKKTGFKRREAARILGLPIRTLNRKILAYGIKPED